MSNFEKIIAISLGIICGCGLGRLWQAGGQGFVIGIFAYLLYVILWIVQDLSEKLKKEIKV